MISKITSFILFWIKFGGCVILALSLFGFLAQQTFLAELVTHFKLQYFILSFIGTIAFILAKNWKWLALALLCLIMNGIHVVPWYIPHNAITSAQHKTLKILHTNVLTQNRNHQKLIHQIKTEQPDIIFLQEVNRRWIKSLQELQTSYPHQFNRPTEMGSDGIAVWSQIPFEHVEELKFGNKQFPSLYIKIQHQNQILSIASTHPLTPMGPDNLKVRNLQMQNMAEYLSNAPEPKMLIGDFNMTPWTPYYTQLIQTTGLRNARKGFGILPSWPVQIPFMKIPIDHCLVSSKIHIKDIRTLESIGSDHLPLLVELSI